MNWDAIEVGPTLSARLVPLMDSLSGNDAMEEYQRTMARIANPD